MDEIGTVLYIFGAFLMLGAGYVTKRAGNTLSDVQRQTPELLRELITYLPSTTGADPAIAAKIEELDRSVRHLQRLMTDLDESTERRFKRLQARARREELSGEEEEASSLTTPPRRDPRQLGIDLFQNGGNPAPDSPPPTLPRLIRQR